ncbi:MAG TPA: hypothetical protein V6D06_19880 [Trichocoleus sp.]
MVASVFSDLDAARLNVASTASRLDRTLAETVCRFPSGAAVGLAAKTSLSPAAAAAVTRLVNLVMELRSHDGGWPTDLPQTPENLALYVDDEVSELLDELSKAQASPATAPGVAPVPASALVQIMPTLISQLLWAVASSGYEIMRLLEGVQARLQEDSDTFETGILRLVPVLSLRTGPRLLAVDLVTQTAPQSTWLAADRVVQLTDGDLEGSPRPVWNWLAEVARQVSQHHSGLQTLLVSGWEVEALSPGESWCSGYLTLSFHLALDQGWGLSPESLSFTLNDFAATVAADTTAVATLAAALGALRTELPLVAPSLGEDALAAWLTLTDEAWIQTFLQGVAWDLCCQRLKGMVGQLAGPGQRTQIVQAAYDAVSAVQGVDGLFKHTFVHQPTLLADLWPRLRWYLAGINPLIMQLMGGMSVQWLSPGSTWQNGVLLLQPLVVVQLETQNWWLDLATGQVLLSLPEPALPGTVLSLALPDLGPQPTPLAALTDWLEAQLEQQSRALALLRSSVVEIELHRLEAHQEGQAAHLRFRWQLVLRSEI